MYQIKNSAFPKKADWLLCQNCALIDCDVCQNCGLLVSQNTLWRLQNIKNIDDHHRLLFLCEFQFGTYDFCLTPIFSQCCTTADIPNNNLLKIQKILKYRRVPKTKRLGGSDFRHCIHNLCQKSEPFRSDFG